MILALIKFLTRVIKLISVSILAGLTIFNFFLGQKLKESVQDTDQFKLFTRICAFSGVLLMVSGILNMFLIKGSKSVGTKHSFWYFLLFLKFVISVLMTPLAYKFASAVDMSDWYEANSTMVQFYLVMTAFLLSTGAKWYREDVANNFEGPKEDSKTKQA